MHIGSYMFGVEWNVEQPTFQSAKKYVKLVYKNCK